MKTKRVLIALDHVQAAQVAELVRRDGSSAASVMRKALALLYDRRDEVMPITVR